MRKHKVDQEITRESYKVIVEIHKDWKVAKISESHMKIL